MSPFPPPGLHSDSHIIHFPGSFKASQHIWTDKLDPRYMEIDTQYFSITPALLTIYWRKAILGDTLSL